MSKLSHSNPDLDDVYTGEIEMSEKENSGAELSPLEQLKSYVASPKKVREQWDEGQTKFYEWEFDIYGQDTPLSDDDKSTWIEGYLYAKREEVE
tara:strand:- start:723 stop:1004 length:282 start_codon:yes stop_codon:yes gene_type:complete